MYCGRWYQTNDLRQVFSKAQTMLGSPISNQSTFYVNPQEDNIVLNILFKNRSFTVGMDKKPRYKIQTWHYIILQSNMSCAIEMTYLQVNKWFTIKRYTVICRKNHKFKKYHCFKLCTNEILF